ncbi:putative vesicular transport protein [Encephalitozoon intestinalis ATCC 50506]|uniref:Vesicular transport protein n=1 Tax=Encephalitozoon intestinalis (strain ATCC 50506) TaxID=876142 RepID=E0S7W6_ENCIT|nr:putative vesicular transport protein [Encephalitozoon intestinalis ATCC 50506]ADM11801.1 putative vesicular transport protein [Encephalitozoon intestinalis ATCC 50506]UTX45550.1 hypothetical protein GPK93_07g11130 [Encephalitozoon intestinalis]
MEYLERSSVGNERSSGNVPDTDSSITILDIPLSISNAPQLKASSETQQNSFPKNLDSAFANHYFVFPQTLERFVNKIKDRKFVYKFSADQSLEIVECNNHKTVYSLGVIDLEKDGIEACGRNISFVVNRNKYRSSVKAREDKEYRKALEEGKKYVRKKNEYEKKMEEIYLTQIKNGRNFVFIDDPEDLPRELKAIVRHLYSESVHVPKTKTFSSNQKIEHLQNVLQNIPGIGINAARSLSLHFQSISNLHSFLKGDNSGLLKEFKVWDSDGKNSRPLGEKQSDKIRNIFVGNQERLVHPVQMEQN